MAAAKGEMETQIDYEKVVRGVVAEFGFDFYVDNLSSVDSKGLCHKTCEVLVRVNGQSPDIAGGVHLGKGDLDVGAGGQSIMSGYASGEIEDCVPLVRSTATRLGKTPMTIGHVRKEDGAVEPREVHAGVTSTQHAEPLKASRRKGVAGYTGPDATAP